MKAQIIQHQWLRYRDQVLPRDAPSVQVIECRRAFYAGAQAFYGILMRAISPGSETTEADLAMMNNIRLELNAFFDSVKAGVA